ncbi:Hypothetical predicted protein [Mytilus galloprovincialis]|uniref:Uncharacterized protein n=1 Tax=Mytilus galloprovincialis TaxID=29158 RepID=A0A8B6GBP1_MYTGA|nr:Hypothetical predicted protein [Mytilus galloprovincialis]
MNGQQRLDFQLTSIQGGRVTESLPDSYAVVKPAVLKTNVPVIPVTDSTCKGCTGDLHEAVQNEYRWLETVSNSKEYDIEERTLVSWGAYHAEHEPIKDFEPCVSALLPLFEEEAKSVAMIKHSFDVIKTSVEALNPGQNPAAYQEYSDSEEFDHKLDMEEWCLQMSTERPQFHYWFLTLKLELDALIFIRAIREGHFKLYIDALTRIIPWFFALDHIHYSRWLPVHVRDMTALSSTNPDAHVEFLSGKFVVHKTKKRFSAIAIDHAHEQNNAVIKSDGGAVGLTENPVALRRWMIAGPEMARLTKEFESTVSDFEVEEDEHHHENKTSVQKSFLKDIWSMVEVMNELGNPFMEDSQDLLVLDTKDIAPTSVVDTIRKIEKIALSQHGKMRLGTKSDLLSKCLEPLTTTTCDAPEVDALVIDGAAIVNMLKPSTSLMIQQQE